MGSGKSTWGKKIAHALDLPFIDLDEEIVAHVGMPIADYFELHGEEKFRLLERAFLKKQQEQIAVISTGGGTPCYYDNMDWIKANGLSLYLYHSAKSLWSRLSQSDPSKRPLVQKLTGEELLQFITDKLEERRPYYEQADIIFEQINTTLVQIIDMIEKTNKDLAYEK